MIKYTLHLRLPYTGRIKVNHGGPFIPTNACTYPPTVWLSGSGVSSWIQEGQRPGDLSARLALEHWRLEPLKHLRILAIPKSTLKCTWGVYVGPYLGPVLNFCQMAPVEFRHPASSRSSDNDSHMPVANPTPGKLTLGNNWTINTRRRPRQRCGCLAQLHTWASSCPGRYTAPIT